MSQEDTRSREYAPLLTASNYDAFRRVLGNKIPPTFVEWEIRPVAEVRRPPSASRA
jgi:hypothetical protein